MHFQAAIIKELVNSGYKVKIRALGKSMGAEFAQSSHIILGGGLPSKGKIVAALQNNRIVIHRVRNISNAKVHTRGDRCFFYDDPVDKREVLAVAEGIYKNGGVRKIKSHSPSRFFLFAASKIKRMLSIAEGNKRKA